MTRDRVGPRRGAGRLLPGHHAVVTGGSSGIGLATARQLASRGLTVSLVARREELLRQVADDLRAGGATVHVAAVDVADQRAVSEAIAHLEGIAGPCDVLVTAAGQARPGHFLELDDDVFRVMMEVDYFGTLHAVRAVVPGMVERGRGSVVAVASGAALLGVFGYSAYSPAKSAVRGLMETLRSELRPHGVHVACAFPADVDTPQLAEENEHKPAETAAISGRVRPVQPEVVATAILRAVESDRFAIYSDRGTRLLSGLGPMLAPALRRFVDRTVRSVR
ncbi:SDR family oxidoreductase [Nocardioides sp.]|uniref:SDR family oxidoreductase n=1 Tax=Nocardioides sp. TaxID=35761 RepID=UPI0027363A11|nr:SDR family oxidoreductase [Nocardioides sp.]MDP3892995.1 SDR family oxidoreductase [Nocardioides sp.]